MLVRTLALGLENLDILSVSGQTREPQLSFSQGWHDEVRMCVWMNFINFWGWCKDERWLIFFISVVIFTMWKQREPSSGSWMQGYVLHMLTLSLIRCMTWRNCSDFSNTDFFPCVWMSEIMMLVSYKERKRKKESEVAQLCLTLCDPMAYQVPPSMGFSRQECWSGLPFPSPGDLPDPGIKPGSPALQADALPTEPPGKPLASYKASQ